MVPRPVRWLAAVVAALAATPTFANNFILTPYGAFQAPVGAVGPYNMAVGYRGNPYFQAGGYGLGGTFSSYGPYNQLPVGAYAAYPPSYAYNGLLGAYSGGYLPQVGTGLGGYAAPAFAPFNTLGYNTPSRYNAYPSTINYVPALYFGQYYASYVPLSGYGPYSPPLTAFTAAGIYRPDGYLAYDPGPTVAAYRGPAAYVADEPATPRNKAIVNVELPADAKVWFMGRATQQTGGKRSFISPDLDGVNQFYKYEIKASWSEDGKPVEQTQTVYVRAGERSTVLFFKTAVAAKR